MGKWERKTCVLCFAALMGVGIMLCPMWGWLCWAIGAYMFVWPHEWQV